MTTEIELLPLPAEDYVDDEGLWEKRYGPYSSEQMEDYARANVLHHTAPLQAEIEALRAEVERLNRYYKNGIDCFANPCERHSGERTPPAAEFFEKYGGQCLICVVDNNKALQAENERLTEALRELEGCEPAGTTGHGGIEARKQAITALKERLK